MLKTIGPVLLLITTATTALAQGTWAPAAPMPQPRAFFAGCTAGTHLFAIGGYDGAHVDTVAAYDTATGAWGSRAPMPVQRTGAQCAESGGLIYVLGGTTNGGTTLTTRVDVYDPATDTWGTPVAPMPTSRANMGVATIDGIIYVAGGSNGESIVEAYDPVSDTWETKAPLPTARLYIATGVIDGRLYAVGSTDGPNLNGTMEIYDPATDAWSAAPSLPTERFIPGAGVLGGRLYVLGGATSVTLDVVEVFDPAAGTWATGPSMPSDRYGFGTGVVDGTLYVYGGASNVSGFTVLSTMDAFSLSTEATPAERTMDLLNAVRSLNLGRGISNSFEAKLQKVLTAFESSATADACDQLKAFINHARAQAGKHLTTAQADQLIAAAIEIRAAVGCS